MFCGTGDRSDRRAAADDGQVNLDNTADVTDWSGRASGELRVPNSLPDAPSEQDDNSMTNPSIQNPPPSNGLAAEDERRLRPGSRIEYDLFLDCVHCGLCTSACPTYLETGDENNSPRGRIYLMRAIADGRLDLSSLVENHLDLCLDCRGCETACPSGVRYGRLIEPFRVEVSDWKSATGAATRLGWLDHLILNHLFAYPGRLRCALAPVRLLQWLWLDRIAETTRLIRLLPRFLQRMYRLLPRKQRNGGCLPEFLPAQGTRRARVGLFTGCVADVLFRQVHWATARVLQENGCDVVVPRQQGCCGAIHYHNGAAAKTIEFMDRNANAFDLDQLDAVVVNVAGCGAMLKDYTHIVQELVPGDEARLAALTRFTDKVRDVSEFLIELGPKTPSGSIPLRAAYDDACHLMHAQKLTDPPRQLLALVPDLQLIEVPESEICCGAAGSYNLTEPEMSDRLARRKVANIRQTEAQAVLTANAGCALQIQASLRSAGLPLWVAHPMQVLDMSYRNLSLPVAIHDRTRFQ